MWYIWRYHIINGTTIDRGCFGRYGFTLLQDNWIEFASETAARLYLNLYITQWNPDVCIGTKFVEREET